MRILYLVRDAFPTFRPDITDLCGVMLPRQGVSCTLVAPAGDPDGGPPGWEGGEVLLAPRRTTRLGRLLGGFLHDLASLARHGRDHDAIQVRNKPVAALAALAAARIRGIPCLYWMSFPYPEDDLARSREPDRGVLRAALLRLRGLVTGWLLYRVVLPRCDHVIVQSPRMRDDLVARGVPRERMTPVPMGVNLERLDAALGGGPAPDRAEPVLAYVGTLDRSRRMEFLLEVLARVRAAGETARLLLVGDASTPGERERLLALVRERGLENAVEVTGWLPQAAGWQRAAAARVGVCALPPGPVTDSMSPTKAVELMALGLPLVVSEHPDQGPLVAGCGAGRCVAYDAPAFAAAVLELLRDPAAAAEMGRRGREEVRRERSYTVIAERLAAAYRTILNRPGARA